MIDELIAIGETFEEKAQEVNYGADKIITGVEFETWVAKTIFYLEKEEPNSSLTTKAIEANKELIKNSYQKYHCLLGILKAIKDIKLQVNKNAKAIWDLNK